MMLLKALLFGLLGGGLCWFIITAMFRRNRLLGWCVAGTVLVHLVLAGALWAAGSRAPKEEPPRGPIYIPIAQAPKPDPIPESVKPKPKPVEQPCFALPAGRPDGDRQQKEMPRGETLEEEEEAGGSPPPLPDPPLDRSSEPEENEVTLPDRPHDGDFDWQDGLRPADFWDPNTGGEGPGRGPGKGPGNKKIGTPEGTKEGPIPLGFERPDTRPGGRVYFVRLKHGAGAWNAYDDGIRQLLVFLNGYFPCERESRAIDVQELRARLGREDGNLPVFLYLYVDDAFRLSGSEMAILKEYVECGGFLFLDSRPDADGSIRRQVTTALRGVLPGAQLSPISKLHPVNTYLFRLASPGVGENILEKRNYGMTRNGRLAVFYTAGNFAHLYSANPPSAGAYITAQYQMGANVMVYAITGGNAGGIQQQDGARATVSTQALEQMNLLGNDAPAGPIKSGQPETNSSKVPTQPGMLVTEPEEIRMLEE